MSNKRAHECDAETFQLEMCFFFSSFHSLFCFLFDRQNRDAAGCVYFSISRNCAPNAWKHLGVGRCSVKKRFSIVQLLYDRNHYFHTVVIVICIHSICFFSLLIIAYSFRQLGRVIYKNMCVQCSVFKVVGF